MTNEKKEILLLSSKCMYFFLLLNSCTIKRNHFARGCLCTCSFFIYFFLIHEQTWRVLCEKNCLVATLADFCITALQFYWAFELTNVNDFTWVWWVVCFMVTFQFYDSFQPILNIDRGQKLQKLFSWIWRYWGRVSSISFTRSYPTVCAVLGPSAQTFCPIWCSVLWLVSGLVHLPWSLAIHLSF